MDSRLLIKPKGKGRLLPKPLLLKDYLFEDISSCSSNGFKSFPRRQCCTTTVRFLIEIDLKPPPLLKSQSKSPLAAFRSLISAVFGSSPENKSRNSSILPRNLSKRILKKATAFWKRESNHKEIQRWKSFDELLKEDREIYHSSTECFTASDECWSGNSSPVVDLNSSDVKNDDAEMQKNGDVLTNSTATSIDTTSSSTKEKQWSVNEEKEQFSPVSVLDCPFDDDEEVSSPFQHRLTHDEGTKKMLIKKIPKFECLTPVNLAKRFASLPDSDQESSESLVPHSSASVDMKEEEQEEDDEESRAEHKALDLLNQMKETLPSYGIRVKADKLLSDFFRERIIAQNVHSQTQHSVYSFYEDLLEEAENWIKGRRPRELFLEWEVPRNRPAYIKDIEKGGKWKTLDQENKEVASELEVEVFTALLNELLVDISSKATI